MNTTNWKDLAELIGIAAIAASLVFVGLQMKQSHEIALAEIYQARTSTVVEATAAMASNPYILAAYTKSGNGRIEEIEPLEQLATEWITLADMMLNENSHYQYTLGYLPEEHWLRVRRNIKRAMQDPFEGSILRKNKVMMRDSFRAIVEEIDRELGSEAGA